MIKHERALLCKPTRLIFVWEKHCQFMLMCYVTEYISRELF